MERLEMKRLLFLFQYIGNPSTVGSILPSSRFLGDRMNERNLFIVYGSAENIIEHVREYGIPYIDYVISGLPFASLPKSVSNKILLETSKILKKDGEFITFQYTMYKKTFIEQFFTKIDVKRELRNVPPAYVFSCSMPQNDKEELYEV